MTTVTITNANITLTGATSGAVAGTISYDSTTSKAFFFPDANLGANELYTLVVSTNVTDDAGNPLEEDYTAIFKTE